ncbi:hypothetical protein HMPREF9997_02338 [Corynebacterium durum F0235]|uniref:Uncharacterized protein n=1 Tax=Corynebacterium durum F0235 TaxID=1035195 RepID=L1MAH8_9CORY|nr:hypothetical protein HMPREF9997_02338 [Corynebacterium durum F0235]
MCEHSKRWRDIGQGVGGSNQMVGGVRLELTLGYTDQAWCVP